jgi:hypothetical protein
LLDSSPRTHSAPSPPEDGLSGAALEVQRSRPFSGLVRAGFVARGVTYGVIGGLAAALAAGAGRGGGTATQQGALELIARAPLGRIVVMVAALGTLAYALWKLALGIIGHGPEGSAGHHLKDRVANLAGGLVYLGLFGVCVRVVIGSAGSGTSEQRKATVGVLGWPGGRLIVAAIGVTLIVVSVVQIYEAVKGKFAEDSKLEDMSDAVARTFYMLGRIGLCARAIVFVLIGYFFVRTAIDYRPTNGIGLDGALAAVQRQTLGPVLLAVVAAGLLIFAVFSLFEARYRRL